MKNIQRLKKNKEFQKVFQNGKSTANRQFVVYVLEQSNNDYSRMGLSVSKKIGNAVTRNRIRRYIKEAVHNIEDKLITGTDFVIIARKPTANMNLIETNRSLNHVLKLAGILHVHKKGDRR